MEKLHSDFTGNESINDGKIYLRQNWKSGCDCPVCGQKVKLYERKITSSMAYGLVLMARQREIYGRATFHVDRFLKDQDCPSSIRGDMAKLRYWGFILPEDEPGYWLLTKHGYDFARGKVRVPRAMHIFNRKVYGLSEETVDIVQALTDRFDIVELLGYDPALRWKKEDIQIKLFNDN